MTLPLRVLDLFSGIGGFSLGLERAGMNTVRFVERDPFCQRVLAKHWPDVPCDDDVTTARFEEGEADVVCGGFPCQDISYAGEGAGLAGERSGLWRELLRAIRVVRPLHAIVENVAALLGRGLGVVLGDLASIGYDAEWHCIPASAVGADHERDRIWIVAHPHTSRLSRWVQAGTHGADETVLSARLGLAIANSPPFPREHGPLRPFMGRGSHGLPNRSHRIAALGNAVVPQIPELIARALEVTNG